jgi:hypothetical protein
MEQQSIKLTDKINRALMIFSTDLVIFVTEQILSQFTCPKGGLPMLMARHEYQGAG